MGGQKWSACLSPRGAARGPGVTRIPPGSLPERPPVSLTMTGQGTVPDGHDLGAHCPGRYGAGIERKPTR